jgi:hypothetical protein
MGAPCETTGHTCQMRMHPRVLVLCKHAASNAQESEQEQDEKLTAAERKPSLMNPIVPITEENAAFTAPDPSLITWSPAVLSKLPFDLGLLLCGLGLLTICSGFSGSE